MQKDFRNAWLLLLLRENSGYGYELRRELSLRSQELNPAVMYRSLRAMERTGLITSRWMRSKAGPARRVYDITPDGLAELERIAAVLRVAHDAHRTFLSAYAQRTESAR
jgi:PadR family transcriptional regulator PadR